ncbi:MAG: ABC transporter ATP-binding protein [Lachnospiraceae bacterium]|nr:ABC transporter ATP-binding protein [Lachnospiraceae bacterium]
MKYILHYMKHRQWKIVLGVTIKFFGSIGELFIPFLLEYMIDDIVPTKDLKKVLLFGLIMVVCAIVVRILNIRANQCASSVARDCTRELRHDLFSVTTNLTGAQFDSVTLPSLISRMTADSYNVQNFIGMIQRMGIRAPILLVGGVFMAMLLDWQLSMVLLCMVPLMAGVVIFVSKHGIPLYNTVQENVDRLTRILRENITGIRVVKALSREEYEKTRYDKANVELARSDFKAGATMALPNPLMNLFLNIGLVLVILFGAHRVESGGMKSGVIITFLIYFNQILGAVLGINRIFIMYTKAGASANRIGAVLDLAKQRPEILSRPEEAENVPFIRFEHVSFTYPHLQESAESADREYAISDLSFDLNRGESLGIIGSTGCGKTTVINLLMRFYDVSKGRILVDGYDVRSYDLGELRRKIGVVFQNDTIFADTIRENVAFGRGVSDAEIRDALSDANILTFIDSHEEGLEYRATKAGANLSGGEKQRVVIARALVGNPEILVLDDASSALDYKTDAALRRAVREHHSDATCITIAQRISSVRPMTRILVMEAGETVGYGTHDELMESCEIYRDIFRSQMGGAENATA